MTQLVRDDSYKPHSQLQLIEKPILKKKQGTQDKSDSGIMLDSTQSTDPTATGDASPPVSLLSGPSPLSAPKGKGPGKKFLANLKTTEPVLSGKVESKRFKDVKRQGTKKRQTNFTNMTDHILICGSLNQGNLPTSSPNLKPIQLSPPLDRAATSEPRNMCSFFPRARPLLFLAPSWLVSPWCHSQPRFPLPPSQFQELRSIHFPLCHLSRFLTHFFFLFLDVEYLVFHLRQFTQRPIIICASNLNWVHTFENIYFFDDDMTLDYNMHLLNVKQAFRYVPPSPSPSQQHCCECTFNSIHPRDPRNKVQPIPLPPIFFHPP